MFNVLLLDARFAVSYPAEGDGFLKAIKIRSAPSFGWEVKPEVPCLKRVYGTLKSLQSMNKDIPYDQIHHFLRQFILLCLHNSVGRITRRFWLTSQAFCPFHRGCP
jgi:hypothetical protein